MKMGIRNIHIIFSIMLMFLSACIGSPKSGNKAKTKSSLTTTNNSSNTQYPSPNFSNTLNYLQNGVQTSYSNVILNKDFKDSIFIRGKEVDTYIRANGNNNTVNCLITNVGSYALVLAASPSYFFNYTTNIKEYYYSFLPGEKTHNQTFCQKTGVVNATGKTSSYIVYSLEDLSLLSTASIVNSSALNLYKISGDKIPSINTDYLYLAISNTFTTLPSEGGCTQSAECKSQNFDCCLNGQCVNDLALKESADTSSNEYKQAQVDILNNPSSILNYPQFYYICPERVTVPTNTTPTPDPVYEAVERVQHLKDLYNCINKIEGELSICTQTYQNSRTGATFNDDRTFASTAVNDTALLPTTTISEVVYAGVTFMKDGVVVPGLSSYISFSGQTNDDLVTSSTVTISNLYTPPSTSVDRNLIIRYKIDGSCTKTSSGSTTAKCEKHYTQGQRLLGSSQYLINLGKTTDHYPASNKFLIPKYADLSRSLKVEVDGVTAPQWTESGMPTNTYQNYWRLVTSSIPAYIEFVPTSDLIIKDTQKVKITFLVDTNVYPVLSSSSPDGKLTALNEVKQICGCVDYSCNLAPVKTQNGTISDYACIYPEKINTNPPDTQTVYLSAKTVPVRYFDSLGVAKESYNPSEGTPEGEAYFKYTNNSSLTPNNLSQYVGFQEIYGSFNQALNPPKPAKQVWVKKGKTYDIYITKGGHTLCTTCGTDYSSTLSKLFPIISGPYKAGGGITPLQSETDRFKSNVIRSDEMLFGRACFVPASMIPWSQYADSDVQRQRLLRQKTQHFYYANGYQRDWYGYDYGAIIGSFDGVRWFAIGSSRRIKAEGSKLFLAINAPFGDLAIDNTYDVQVIDAAFNLYGTVPPSKDIDTDAAECQRYHMCENDLDCATTLGSEYSCEDVTDISTTWPLFDENGKEIPETTQVSQTLYSLFKMSGNTKRCVYRGRGALCSNSITTSGNLTAVDQTYNKSTTIGTHLCSSNTYCQSMKSGTTLNTRFNTKLNRIARSYREQSSSTDHQFGLATKIIGRPTNYFGSEAVPSDILSTLASNDVNQMCIPGKKVDQAETTKLYKLSTVSPTDGTTSDQVLNNGQTLGLNTYANNYYSACPAVDSNGNYFFMKSDLLTKSLNDSELVSQASTQFISSNALQFFENYLNRNGLNIIKDFYGSTPIVSPIYQKDICLKSPGTACFSDYECAPNKQIASKVSNVLNDILAETDATKRMNYAEVKFWQEDLVCSQELAKTDSLYDPRNNRCCREVGKPITIFTNNSEYVDQNGATTTTALSYHNSTSTNNIIAGVHNAINNISRYSRLLTVYDKLVSTDETKKLLPLQSRIKDNSNFANDFSVDKLAEQFKTFSSIAERTCCTANWVREFSSNDHKWGPSKLFGGKVSTSRLTCYNRAANFQTSECRSPYRWDDPGCKYRQPSSDEATQIMRFLERFELTGIPQIIIPTSATLNGTSSELSLAGVSLASGNDSLPIRNQCFWNTSSVLSNPTVGAADTFTPGTTEFGDFIGSTDYIKSTNSDALGINGNSKPVFSGEKVACCLPAGTQMKTGDDPNLCCTGLINAQTNKCALPDLTDVSIYVNRYVSSEAKNLDQNMVDPLTGYLKDPMAVIRLACTKSMCASGKIIKGVAYNRYRYPTYTSQDEAMMRFIGEDDTADNVNGLRDLFRQGLRWNNHVYCAPANFQAPANTGNSAPIIETFDCSQLNP